MITWGAASAAKRSSGGMAADAFFCNICGTTVTTIPWAALDRDHGICPVCGAQVRFRAIAYLIGVELYGISSGVPAWPPIDKVVYGISDRDGFEAAFRRAFRYRNTPFDRSEYPDAPFLDIVDPPAATLGTADVVSCSDVLEHVPPPVQRAFDGLFALLIPGGALVFTVPYTFDATIEHFPDLYDWKLRDDAGGPVLVNRTRAGALQQFTVFAHFERAGFTDVRVMAEDVPAYGMRFDPWSRPIVARRPGVRNA